MPKECFGPGSTGCLSRCYKEKERESYSVENLGQGVGGMI